MSAQLSLVRGPTAFPEPFAALWDTFPKRMGDNPKALAFTAYRKALKITDAATIQRAAEEYAKAQRHQLGTPYLPMLATWLNQQRFDQYANIPASVAVEKIDPEKSLWEARMNGWIRRKFWVSGWGPKPGEPHCQAPKPLTPQD